LEQFRPELLLVSAGFDAHERDPLGQMRVTTDGFEVLTTRLLRAADELCQGRIVFVSEGGYDLQALAECCERVLALCSCEKLPPPPPVEGDTRRSERSLSDFRRAHRR
jgi:acetoin utilization deacetylase AcuC-like enzyme